MTRPPPADPFLLGLLVGVTAALAILATGSFVGWLCLPDAHWRGGALAFVACPAVLLGAREALSRRT